MAIILSSSASEDTPPVIRAASLPHLSDSDGVTGMFRPTRLAVASILSSDVKSTRGLYLSNSVCSAWSRKNRSIQHRIPCLVFPLRPHEGQDVLHVILEHVRLVVPMKEGPEMRRNDLVSVSSWNDALRFT